MISLIGSDDSADYNELEQKTAKLNATIQKARTEANLPRLFKAKRRHSLTKHVNEVNESLQLKKSKTNEESEDVINNRDELMARLSTFSVLFHHMLRPLNALQCAKHGWKDTNSTVEKDPKISVLICDSCKNNMFVIDIDSKMCDEQKVIEIKKKNTSGLYQCHKEDCQWHDSQCKDSLYRFPLFTISEGLEQFKSEAQLIIAACLQHQSLPDIQHPLDEKTLSKVKHFSKEDKSLDNTERAYILSLFGWKSLDSSIPGVKCDLCFTRKAFYQLKQGEAFNVVNEHKSYCPCINAETADSYTPNTYSSHKNVKISGADWLKEVMLMEYSMIIKKEDLSITHKVALDEKLYALRQKIYESSDNLKNWQSRVP